MAKNRNIIDDIFDVLVNISFLCGETCKLVFCKLLNIEEKFDLEKFLKNTGLKNFSGEIPKQIKITKGEKGDVYYFSLPDGLSSNDFSKYKIALEEKLDKEIDIKCKNGHILIEIFEKTES